MIETNKKIDELIQKSSLRINNAINDADISSSVLLFGYTPEKMSVGKQILDTTNTANQNYMKEHGDVVKALENKNINLKLSKVTYMQFVKVSRIVFKNDLDAFYTLKLNGERERSFTGIISQIINYYEILLANETWLSKMATFGTTSEKLQLALDKVNQTATYQQSIMIEKGEAQQATTERDQLVDKLADWMSDFLQIAKIALADKPQLLEKLQITVKNK